MTSTLPRVSHEHDQRLLRHVEQLPRTADLIGSVPYQELRPHVDEAVAFLNGLLVPHMEAAEATLYPELERLLQNRHSMTPMRREHVEIRRLIDGLVGLQTHLHAGRFSTGEAVDLRRTLYRLYAFLKVHMAEEQLYLGIIEHGIGAEAGDRLAAAMDHAGISTF